MNTANAAGGSSLRPAWHKGTGGQGGRGFQPPPTVTSDRSDKDRSSSWGQERGGNSNLNKFSALQDDDDGGGPPSHQNNDNNNANGKSDHDKPGGGGNSRSEAFRTSFHRASSTGSKPPGRTLADLAARVPDPGLGGRRHTSGFESRNSTAAAGRIAGYRSNDPAASSTGSAGGTSVEAFKPDPSVVRFTREKLLSMRPQPKPGEELPDLLIDGESTNVLADEPQDPVCWDTFDAEEIWATAPRERRASTGTPKGMMVGGVGGGSGGVRAVPPEAGDMRRHSVAVANPGRWQRGVALPPSEEGGQRSDDANSPDELWDDPVGGATGAAADFSAFGHMPEDLAKPAGGDTFDFDKMAEASRRLEEEMRGVKPTPAPSSDANGSEEIDIREVKVDPKRPLASSGTKIASGSGDNVNVFEDFDAPSQPEPEEEADEPAIRSGAVDPSASSLLMKMIGVTSHDRENGTADAASDNPWGTANDEVSNKSERSSIGGDPVFGGALGAASTVPLNPWGDPIVPTANSQNMDAGGLDLRVRLEAFAAEQKAREARVAAEIEQQRARQEARRRQEEAQRRALAQRQAEERARQQSMQTQQPTSQQSQIELVLMERICAILENSWGRSDLVSILSTLHSEDSRVIPLLNNVDALRTLMARSPQRVAIRRDPTFAGDMAVLLLTNTQWQQQQQQQQTRAQQEEAQRREKQRLIDEENSRGQPVSIPVIPDAPWYYSDPQQNIQGPFRGEEMRQWLEAGYFKGDLPISQQPGGPFRPLSAIFPDLNVAFKNVDNNAAKEADAAAAAASEEKHRRKKEAEERRAVEAALAKAEAEREAAAREEAERQRLEQERLTREKEERERAKREEQARFEAEAAAAAAVAAAEKEKSSNGGNEQSTQLKMMLGMSGGDSISDLALPPFNGATDTTENRSSSEKKTTVKKKSQQKQAEKPTIKTTLEPAVATAKPAAAAWGGAVTAKPRKSMSEIQREEARAAAIVAAQRDTSVPRQSSSGWANVAATGTSGWSGTTIKQNAAAIAAANNPVIGLRPGGQPRAKPLAVGTSKARKSGAVAEPRASSTPAEEFGASMSPAMEKWCKEQMMKIKGKDDITLVAFCMTLGDANEIREYLTTYLGSSPQVNAFATEFINKRGLGTSKEEWETPGSAKKGRKKKGGR